MKEFPWSFASATLLVQSLRDSAAATPVGGPRLAAEIPDIFLPLARNDVRNDDGGGIVLRLDWEPLREHVLPTG